MDFDVRDYIDSDRAFVLNSWVLSLRASGIYRRCPDKVLLPALGRITEKLLDSDCSCKVLLVKGTQQIAGWLCYRGSTICFAYVKYPYRRKGAFTRLLNDCELNNGKTYYIFSTLSAFKIAEKKKWVHHPLGIVPIN